jgi:hypothetical protein
VGNVFGAVFEVSVSALSQDIKEQNGTLPSIQPIFLNGVKVWQALHYTISCSFIVRFKEY